MRAIHVGIGHDDDAVIAQRLHIQFLDTTVYTATQSRHQGADLIRSQGLVLVHAFDVENLAFERQNGLKLAIAACLAEPPAESPSTMNSSQLPGSRS